MDKKPQVRPIRIRIAAAAETHDCGDGTTEIIINSPDFGEAIIAPLNELLEKLEESGFNRRAATCIHDDAMDAIHRSMTIEILRELII